MVSHHKRRVTIESDLWDSINYYIADERLKLPKVLRESLTPEIVIHSMMKGEMIATGHYPPKCEKEMKETHGEGVVQP